MATNKRKDAAALFELIDRSTLKVPKNAGALKIPSWWTSKTNSPAPPPSTPNRDLENSNPIKSGDSDLEPAPPAPPPIETSQTRLFDPPPPEITPTNSPSFRPPSASGSGPAMHPSMADSHETTGEGPSILTSPEPAASPPPTQTLPKVFAPHTYARERKPWSPPRPGAFARLPGWVILTGAAGIVIVVILIVYVAKKSGAATQPVTQKPLISTSAPSQAQPLLPPTMVGGIPSASRGDSQVPIVPTPVQAVPARVGQIMAAGTVHYVSDQYYVIICSTPSQTIAQRNARWLADQGIDVAVEGRRQQNQLMYTLISVRSFPSASAAEPFRQEIIRIGDMHNREAKDAFRTAYAQSGLSSPAARGTAPAARGR